MRTSAIGAALCLLPALSGAVPPDGGPAPPAEPESTPRAGSRIRSPEDGWFDLSGFLDTSYGFVPAALPVTEPAVGYGAGLALAFMGRQKEDARPGLDRPNVTAVAGLYTENGTWGGALADLRTWGDERVQTFVALLGASVNLDFYGIGTSSIHADDPLTYNLLPVGGLVQAKYRIGGSRSWVGLSYTLVVTQVTFDAPDETPGLPEFRRDSRIGGLTPSFTYDSRDSIFTPSRGSYLEATGGLYAEVLGGDNDFQRVDVNAFQFLPLHPKLVLGLRAVGSFTFGRAPFYVLPYIDLRGVPKMRDLGRNAGEVEAELRWQLWKRFSLVGFAGEGRAWTDAERFNRDRKVTAGGVGFRYEVARKYRLHMGVDVAWAGDGPAFYVIFGSAWMRP
jgi:hypothetical protein